jgi:hypothetical protein
LGKADGESVAGVDDVGSGAAESVFLGLSVVFVSVVSLSLEALLLLVAVEAEDVVEVALAVVDEEEEGSGLGWTTPPGMALEHSLRSFIFMTPNMETRTYSEE